MADIITRNEPINIFDIDSPIIPASHGKRLANYVIDLILFYSIFFGLGIFIAIFFPEYLIIIEVYQESLGFWDNVLSLLLYALYMGIVEAIFKGRSLGKLITGTIAVQENGQQISNKQAFLRGLCRAIPFCTFSALPSPCNPWQDKWTNTVVVNKPHVL